MAIKTVEELITAIKDISEEHGQWLEDNLGKEQIYDFIQENQGTIKYWAEWMLRDRADIAWAVNLIWLIDEDGLSRANSSPYDFGEWEFIGNALDRLHPPENQPEKELINEQ